MARVDGSSANSPVAVRCTDENTMPPGVQSTIEASSSNASVRLCGREPVASTTAMTPFS